MAAQATTKVQLGAAPAPEAVELSKVLMLVHGHRTQRDCQESEFPGVDKLW